MGMEIEPSQLPTAPLSPPMRRRQQLPVAFARSRNGDCALAAIVSHVQGLRLHEEDVPVDAIQKLRDLPGLPSRGPIGHPHMLTVSRELGVGWIWVSDPSGASSCTARVILDPSLPREGKTRYALVVSCGRNHVEPLVTSRSGRCGLTSLSDACTLLAPYSISIVEPSSLNAGGSSDTPIVLGGDDADYADDHDDTGLHPTTSLPPHAPDFCFSVQGTADSNGRLHGDGVAVLAWRNRSLSGQWSHGLPCGSVRLASAGLDGGCVADGAALELVTERPSASDYGQFPTRVAPGYLWPQPSADHSGMRVVTMRVSEGMRTYEVSASQSNGITMRCVDQSEGRTGGGKLPPRAAGGILEDGYFNGDEVCLVMHVSRTAEGSVVYVGGVAGSLTSPFQRSGNGRLYVPYRGKRGFLSGLWLRDKFQAGRGASVYPLRCCEEVATILIQKAAECPTCLGPYARQESNHRCVSRVEADVRPGRPRMDSAQPTRHDGLKPVVHLLGFDGVVVSGLVRQNMDFATSRHLGGGGGAFAYVALDIKNASASRCYAKRCRETLASRAIAECPHLHALRESCPNAVQGVVALPPGRSLDGFPLLLGVDIAAMPSRSCRSCESELCPDKGEGLRDGLEGDNGKVDDKEDSDDEATDCGSVETWPVDTLSGYIPTIHDILCMSHKDHVALSQFHDLPTQLSDTLMRLQLVELFHAGEVGQLSSYINEALPSARRRQSGGQSQSSTASPADFRTAHRTRRCVGGSTC